MRIPRYVFVFVWIILFSFHHAAAERATPVAGGRVTIFDPSKLPSGTQIWRDVAYGKKFSQKMDVYAPFQARHAPVIVMVHGGGWRRGDKAYAWVVENKVSHWIPKGYIFISVNYRLYPQADVLMQAGDVASALAFVQNKIQEWGGDPESVILMGHSAGAHLVSLLSVNPALAEKAGARHWKGTVSLDSAMMDVVKVMQRPHYKFYDDVMGRNPDFWRQVSPQAQLSKNVIPLYIVCSSGRRDSCPPSHDLSNDIKALGGWSEILEEPQSHGDINKNLGLAGSYTNNVSAAIERMLKNKDND